MAKEGFLVTTVSNCSIPWSLDLEVISCNPDTTENIRHQCLPLKFLISTVICSSLDLWGVVSMKKETMPALEKEKIYLVKVV